MNESPPGQPTVSGHAAHDNPLGSAKRGEELLAQLHGQDAASALAAEMQDIAPAFVDMTIEWALGGILARPGLDLLTRELLLVAACTTLGHAPLQLRAHAEAARRLGATKEQLVEAILQLTFYASGPSIRSALLTLKAVFDEKS
ncbi:carboxymuconolactone decarboxylase family protein [Frateuria terrea]|uniref:4-carboxymuconolactone decarboxylase n=1 Tax=Frateuria terrea TaxID=529704 RepID=A0A1H6U9S4_9GAMM|nr:carboxymuconolactone decarboxylase family protein [Frateuria terrea]SEI88296.1 4-carboxymuconolactone decarboxylase [Frateuria terrea]SFP37810.1 4-carboxymuconolactone decarboxylase [Frateuria terrea]